MTNETPPYQDRIAVDPDILVGKPVIKGTRIPVSLILNLLGHGYDFARIRLAYPELTDEDIRAAVAFSEALVNREEVRPFSSGPPPSSEAVRGVNLRGIGLNNSSIISCKRL